MTNAIRRIWLPFRVQEKFKDRHKILRALQRHLEENDHPGNIPDDNNLSMTYQQLLAASDLSSDQLRSQEDYLLQQKEIAVYEENFTYFYIISQEGTVSYYDSKYLTLGRKDFRDNLYDKIKIISTIILLLIAVVTFLVNTIVTQKNAKEIELIKKDLQKVRLVHKH